MPKEEWEMNKYKSTDLQIQLLQQFKLFSFQLPHQATKIENLSLEIANNGVFLPALYLPITQLAPTIASDKI